MTIPNYKFAGFSLFELLVCLSIISIILVASAPSTQALNKKNQLEIIGDELKAGIQFAKLQAFINAEDLILTPLSGSADWSIGMLLSREKGRKIIREWHWQSAGINVKWQGFQSKEYLLFSPNINNNIVNGTFSLSDKAQNHFKLIMNRLGRARVEA